MAKYIELDLVLKEVEPDYRPQLARRISEIPAADVRPVVRGRWVNGKCDNCGEHAPYWCFATTFHESNYCPNCGADMREAQDG